MKLTFEDINLPQHIQNVVEELIESDIVTNGNISVNYVPFDEMECYDTELPDDVINKSDEIFAISKCVAGSWDQPLGLVAVAY